MITVRFYLGVPEPSWLGQTDVPLFVSARRLRRQSSYPRARGPWALDSGGFTELSTFGRWTVDARTYAREVERWSRDVGSLDFAAVQDWMCESYVLAKTGGTVDEHQQRTVASYLQLLSLAPSVPWLPVVQGWTVADYMRHVDVYRANGVDLAAMPRVGVGSICRRQATDQGESIIRAITARGIKCHAFGVKVEGLRRYGDVCASADSMAWSLAARKRSIRLPGHTHASCSSCLAWALEWRSQLAVRPSR